MDSFDCFLLTTEIFFSLRDTLLSVWPSSGTPLSFSNFTKSTFGSPWVLMTGDGFRSFSVPFLDEVQGLPCTGTTVERKLKNSGILTLCFLKITKFGVSNTVPLLGLQWLGKDLSRFIEQGVKGNFTFSSIKSSHTRVIIKRNHGILWSRLRTKYYRYIWRPVTSWVITKTDTTTNYYKSGLIKICERKVLHSDVINKKIQECEKYFCREGP